VAALGVEVGVLRIEPAGGVAEEYTVTATRNPMGDVSGVRLTKPDLTQYHVDLEQHSCDCPDCQYRSRECKHHKAVVAAFKALLAA
jgi:hypothetical protein